MGEQAREKVCEGESSETISEYENEDENELTVEGCTALTFIAIALSDHLRFLCFTCPVGVEEALALP